MSKIIEIDGSQGEGGGQMLRTSLALALITCKPFRLRNIRARRSRPGLQAQHLTCVRAAAKIGNAKLRGASINSVDLTFEPDKVTPGEYRFPIGTAGATSLVLHTIYLPLALAGGVSAITVVGGTHVKASPCFDFLERSWVRYLRTLGISIGLRLERVGFYPRGGGVIHARIDPARRLVPFKGMTTSEIARATIHCGVAGLPADVGHRLIRRVTARLSDLGLQLAVHTTSWEGGPGCMIGVELPTEPAPTFLFSLGEKGKPAEAVANAVADDVTRFLKAAPPGVDEHSADQLLLPLALAEGVSEFRVATLSSHLLTNAQVIGQFVERTIACDGAEGESGLVRVE